MRNWFVWGFGLSYLMQLFSWIIGEKPEPEYIGLIIAPVFILMAYIFDYLIDRYNSKQNKGKVRG